MKQFTFKQLVFILIAIVILTCWALIAWADEIDVEKLANAIYKSEGGAKATYLYGIRSVKYDANWLRNVRYFYSQ